MYHPRKMVKVLNSTSWLYSLYSHTPERPNKQDYPSKLEISFFLDRGASSFVLNYPTYSTIAKLPGINHTSNTTPHTSKTLTVANRTEFPIVHFVTFPLNTTTTIEDDFRHFLISFAVAY